MDAPTKYELEEALNRCDDIDRCVKNKLNNEQTEQVLNWNERQRFFNDLLGGREYVTGFKTQHY